MKAIETAKVQLIVNGARLGVDVTTNLQATPLFSTNPTTHPPHIRFASLLQYR